MLLMTSIAMIVSFCCGRMVSNSMITSIINYLLDLSYGLPSLIVGPLKNDAI